MIRNEIFERIIRYLGPGGETLLRMVMQEFSWEEIGKALKAKPDTVRMRWNRATRAIQLQFRAENEVRHD